MSHPPVRFDSSIHAVLFTTEALTAHERFVFYLEYRSHKQKGKLLSCSLKSENIHKILQTRRFVHILICAIRNWTQIGIDVYGLEELCW